MSEKVAAIVVTYNRKDLLVRCLNALLQQTPALDRIVLVDNASTDGTDQLILADDAPFHPEKYPAIAYLRLAENTGGAGGFYTGMKWAYEAGYDWLWLMDDDGYVAPNCLAELLKVQANLDVIGSAVVLPENPAQLSWKLRVLDATGQFQPRTYISQYDELVARAQDGVYLGTANYFNAILFHRRAIATVGFVQRELFIWGDEYEYSLRCKAANLRVGTCIEAFYFHPEKLSHISQLKYYYLVRNLYYTYAKYGEITYSPLVRTFYPLYILFKYLKITPSVHPLYLFQVLRAAWCALNGTLIPYAGS